jgi:hypothetical protein
VNGIGTDSIEEGLRELGRVCARMGSTFCSKLLDAAARDYRDGGPLRDFFEADPDRGRVPRLGLRLMGALQHAALDGSAPALAAHYPSCGGDGDAEAAWREARVLIARDGERFARFYSRTPQTNEVARSMPLLAGLLAIVDAEPLPVALFDVGTSAGLNLRLDRFRYEGDGWSWGDPASPLTLRNRIRAGRPGHLDARLDVIERAGCDLHPLDVSSEADCLELRAYVWADQIERFARLDAAIAIARRAPANLERADFLEWIPRRVVPRAGAVSVVMHSIVTEHLAPEVRARMHRSIEDACSAATRSAPMAWLRLEPGDGTERYETRVTLWPSGAHFAIARSDGHAQSIEWTGA